MISFVRYMLGWSQPESVKVTTEEEALEKEIEAELELDDINEVLDAVYNPPEHAQHIGCIEKSGIVTFLEGNYGLIDGSLYFEKDVCTCPVMEGDVIRYKALKTDPDAPAKVVKVFKQIDECWDGEAALPETVVTPEQFHEVIEKTFTGQVVQREGRRVILEPTPITFNLDEVESSFVPIVGDWLQVLAKVQWLSEARCGEQDREILEVISISPLRRKLMHASIMSWDEESGNGTCDRSIYFTRAAWNTPHSYMPQVNQRIVADVIECSRGPYIWRALTLLPQAKQDTHREEKPQAPVEEDSQVTITKNVKFNSIKFDEKRTLHVVVKNISNENQTMRRWKLDISRRNTQLYIEPLLRRNLVINPSQSFTFKITCTPKFLGRSTECLIFEFDGFQLSRFIAIDVTESNDLMSQFNRIETGKPDKMKMIAAMKDMQRRDCENFVPGVAPYKAPKFIAFRIGTFSVPEKLWTAVLGTNEDHQLDICFNNTLPRVERAAPHLLASLNITNYRDVWHTLLFLEEIEQILQLRRFDMVRAFMTRAGEYLCLEVKGLTEKRPSLIVGDKVLARDNWTSKEKIFEGFIHKVNGDNVLIKFHSSFHIQYTGQDVSIEFQSSRSVFRRMHQAVNVSINNLGPEILFPSRINLRNPQFNRYSALPASGNPDESTHLYNIGDIKWYNSKLNPRQKEAVRNILLGIARPMPYCIFGPPGTGKTITLVEAILQILNNITDSRILIATPSNSSANLLTERLVENSNLVVGSMVRVIANHLADGENLPQIIIPYCATVDLARENTAQSKFEETSDGLKLACRADYIARQRVIVTTCTSCSLLTQLALPRGHFTHILVDEAGQCSEPEILIPLSLVDKREGQIVLAGDPMQLGPIVLSRLAECFYYGESYLSRLLERFPYQKDVDGHGNDSGGFDQRLITKLNYNYRSVPEVLSLISEMFYDSSLVSQLSSDTSWVRQLLELAGPELPRLQDCSKENRGGIFVCGIRGMNKRAEDSPSWFNFHEASMVLLLVSKLYKKKIDPDQIGIITPYVAQVRWIKKLFETSGIAEPKVGTVEEFQGQERHIVIVSTVRSSTNVVSGIKTDLEQKMLGFINNPKRVNVAISRAQVALVLFGHPQVLYLDPLWRKVLTTAYQNGNYTGSDLPRDMVQLLGDNSQE